MKKLTLVALAAVLCGPAMAQTSADAVAQPSPPAGTPVITEQDLQLLDLNGDGAVSRLEMESFSTRLFKALDANANGGLNVDEATRMISLDQFRLLDKNGNGSLSAAEFTNQMLADHAAADRDGDGLLN